MSIVNCGSVYVTPISDSGTISGFYIGINEGISYTAKTLDEVLSKQAIESLQLLIAATISHTLEQSDD